MICVFTDGLPELVLPTEGQLGMRKAARLIQGVSHLPATEAREIIATKLDELRGDTPLADDITFVLLRAAESWGVKDAVVGE